ncbi:HNH endonuclease [Pseudomonas sp. MWU12-2115]|uniref:HNH endonuclease n=1 Tax=unclassified Pseudomonas TaxID=196821 RepID=UPI000CD56586|nr:HNH endonuclease [Pseudomonas sp. MWU12-2020]RBB99208.1 HNH endonuclease [Pseudomonas sp. MWU12-2115]
MKDLFYCPYTDKELNTRDSSIEHIIPLSLGGSNSFTISVSKEYNSKAGTDIDGMLANDFLVLIRRKKYDARGHSKKPPKAILKKSSINKENGIHPVQIEFSGQEGLKIYDPINKKELSKKEITGKIFSSEFTLSRHGRLKFAAKAALSGGYFAFGEWFRNNVNHKELRALMDLNSEVNDIDFSGFGLTAYDEFMPANEQDSDQLAMDKLFCEIVQGSCICFVPGPANLGIIIGILGKHVATLNVPANTNDFPFTEANDLGHAIIIESGQANRMSYREFAKIVYERLPTTTE